MLGVIAASRFVRFSIDGVLAIVFGTRILKWARDPGFVYFIIALVVISIVASAVSIYGWIRRSRTAVERPQLTDTNPEAARR